MSNNYKTCDGWYPIFNTLYLTFGISIITIIIILLLILLLIQSANIKFFRHVFFILIYINLLLLPFILTYIHINNIKYKCHQNKKIVLDNILFNNNINNKYLKK
jgi:hypothetical protein